MWKFQMRVVFNDKDPIGVIDGSEPTPANTALFAEQTD